MTSSPLTSADADAADPSATPAYDAAGGASRARLETAYRELAAARDALEQRRVTEFHLRVDMAERRAEAVERQADNLRAARDRLLGRVEALKEANAGLRRNLQAMQAALDEKAQIDAGPSPGPAPEPPPDHESKPAAAPVSTEAAAQEDEGSRPFLLRIRHFLRRRDHGESS